VRDVVHEHVLLTVAVQVLHLALVDDRLLDLLVGAEGPLQHGPGAHVLQLGPYEGAAFARLHVLELDHGEQPLGEVEGHAVLEVVGRDGHALTRSFGDLVSARQPSGVTTTVSSIRTPPVSGRYTPGSTVTTEDVSRVSVDVDAT